MNEFLTKCYFVKSVFSSILYTKDMRGIVFSEAL